MARLLFYQLLHLADVQTGISNPMGDEHERASTWATQTQHEGRLLSLIVQAPHGVPTTAHHKSVQIAGRVWTLLADLLLDLHPCCEFSKLA